MTTISTSSISIKLEVTQVPISNTMDPKTTNAISRFLSPTLHVQVLPIHFLEKFGEVLDGSVGVIAFSGRNSLTAM